MERLVIFLATAYMLIGVSYANVSSKHFTTLKWWKDNGQATFAFVDRSSLFECVVSCLSRDGCLAVVHHNMNMSCTFLNSTAFLTTTEDDAFTYVHVKDDCVYGWVRFGESCYLFGQQADTWFNSMGYCQSLGATLVEIESATENAFLKQTLSNITNPNHWIGLTDVDVEGVWLWASGPSAASYTNWGTSQPNNGVVSNCGAIWESFAHNWVDEPCSGMFNPICEQPRVPLLKR